MPEQTLTYVALALLGGVQLLAVAYVARSHWRRSGGAGRSGTGDAVACPECGTENDAEFRYCRRCVAELPGGVVGREGASSADSRGLT